MTDPTATILQIIPRLDTGGAELSTIEITEAVVRAGGRMLVLSEGGRLGSEITRLGGELIPFPAATKNPVRMLANGRHIAALVGSEGVDLLHARSRAPAWSALMAARRTGKPFVTTYHGAYGNIGRAKTLYNSVMARGDIVIANSEFTARLIRFRHALPAARLHVIHRGVDLKRFDPAAITPERMAALRAAWNVTPRAKIILQAARLTRWKGQGVLIEAARLLRAQGQLGDAVIVLAGDAQGRDGYAAELKAQITAAGLDDHVRIAGHCADIAAAYRLAHVTVVASIEPEAFGRAAAEALAMECPVAATDIGAPPEILYAPSYFQGTRTYGRPSSLRMGWLVEPEDPQALAAVLHVSLTMAPPERAEIGREARAQMQAHFTVARMQHATLAVYDSLLGTNLADTFGAGAPQGDGAGTA